MMNGVEKNVCASCGRASYPCHSRCPACGGTDFTVQAFEGTATLLTFTRVHMLSLAYTDLFITLGIVEFPDGTRALGRLDVEEPEIGMKLKAGFGTLRDDPYIEITGLRLTKD
jgi:uncharacterized OB-fold protein